MIYISEEEGVALMWCSKVVLLLRFAIGRAVEERKMGFEQYI